MTLAFVSPRRFVSLFFCISAWYLAQNFLLGGEIEIERVFFTERTIVRLLSEGYLLGEVMPDLSGRHVGLQ